MVHKSRVHVDIIIQVLDLATHNEHYSLCACITLDSIAIQTSTPIAEMSATIINKNRSSDLRSVYIMANSNLKTLDI